MVIAGVLKVTNIESIILVAVVLKKRITARISRSLCFRINVICIAGVRISASD